LQVQADGEETRESPVTADASLVFLRKLDESLNQFHLESMEAIRKLEYHHNEEPAWATEVT
jgi:hypothetical protein